VQNVELLTVKAGVASSNHYVLNGSSTIFNTFVSYPLHIPMW